MKEVCNFSIHVALTCTIFEIYDVEKYRDLKIKADARGSLTRRGLQTVE